MQAAANDIIFEAAISNTGTAAQNVKVAGSITYNANIVFADTSAGKIIPGGTNDTIATTLGYKAINTGNYTAKMRAMSDSIAPTTIISKTFSVTDTVYARDAGTAGAGYFMVSESCGGSEIGNVYDMYADQTATSISAHINNITVPGGVIYAIIYASDLATIVAQTDYITVTAADKNKLMYLPLLNAVDLKADSTYFVAVGSEQSTSDSIGISVSGTSAIQTSFLLDKDNCNGNGAGTWYYITGTPMVRINFSVCAALSASISASSRDSIAESLSSKPAKRSRHS